MYNQDEERRDVKHLAVQKLVSEYREDTGAKHMSDSSVASALQEILPPPQDPLARGVNKRVNSFDRIKRWDEARTSSEVQDEPSPDPRQEQQQPRGAQRSEAAG